MKENSKLQGSHQEKVRMKKKLNLYFVVGNNNNNNNFILCTKIQNLNSLPRNLQRTLLKATLEDPLSRLLSYSTALLRAERKNCFVFLV